MAWRRLAAMNIFVLAVGGVAMLSGHMKLNLVRLALYGALTPVIFTLALGGSYFILNTMINNEYVMDKVVKNMQTAIEPIVIVIV